MGLVSYSQLSNSNNHQPRNNELQLLIDNKLDFIKIKERQIDSESNNFVFASVLSQQNPQISNSILINVGKYDFNNYQNKVFIVLDSKGNLVGRIINLGAKSSVVQLVNDVNNKVIVEDKNNQLKSALMTPISHNKADLFGITHQDIISIGDTLYTSSKSDIYIDRIPVCKVSNVRDNKEKGPFKKVIVDLLADLSRINFVIVIASDSKTINNDL